MFGSTAMFVWTECSGVVVERCGKLGEGETSLEYIVQQVRVCGLSR